MASLESHPPRHPEAFLDELLASRPPLPVDRADIDDVVEAAAEHPATEPGWAWDSVPLWLAEVTETYDRVGKQPIVVLDLCSSVPMYAQRLRHMQFQRVGERSRGLVNGLFHEQSLARLAHESVTLRTLAQALSRDKEGRELLAAAVQEALYELTPDEAHLNNTENPLFRARLEGKFQNQRCSYQHYTETRGRGPRTERIDHQHTYVERLAQLRIPDTAQANQEARQRLAAGSKDAQDRALARQTQEAGPALAQAYAAWQANVLADSVVGSRRYRPARILSFDATNPMDVAVSGLAKMPASAQAFDLFTHALKSLHDPSQHLTGNVFEPLPFPDNSLSLITCFDGWPFHFQSDPALHAPDEDFGCITAGVLENLYKKLAHGGKIVIFPWAVHSQDYATKKGGSQALNAIAIEFCGKLRESLEFKVLPRATLLSYMSPADQETSLLRSPILSSPDDSFSALVITKSSAESLRDLHAKKLGSHALTGPDQD